MRRSIVLLALAAFLLGASPVAPGPSATASGAAALPPAVARALRGVVSVRVRELEKVPVFRGGRFEMEPIQGSGAGSGVVVSVDGLVLTNAHVVEGSSEVRIRVLAGDEVEARVVAVDEASDLALLRARGGSFHPIPFADRPPDPGTPAFVVGDRDDAGPAVVPGRIGTHARVRVGARPLEFWREVDAPVGPGDSGGALLDAEGNLLGIPSLLIQYAPQAGRALPRASGLFIPAAHAHRSLQKMLDGSTVVWPWLGLVLEDPLLAASAGRSFADDQGVRVRSVLPGSPAETAGLESGDRILGIGARRPRDNFEALDAVLDLEPGAPVKLQVERGGARLEFDVTAGTRPADPRPDPLDDFALHTGLRLEPRPEPAEGRTLLAFAGISTRARSEMPPFEAELFAAGPILGSLLPGQDALAGSSKRLPVASLEDLSALLPRCFVNDQFVALAHWTSGRRKTIDRAHVHRKVYPVVL